MTGSHQEDQPPPCACWDKESSHHNYTWWPMLTPGGACYSTPPSDRPALARSAHLSTAGSMEKGAWTWDLGQRQVLIRHLLVTSAGVWDQSLLLSDPLASPLHSGGAGAHLLHGHEEPARSVVPRSLKHGSALPSPLLSALGTFSQISINGRSLRLLSVVLCASQASPHLVLTTF